MSVPRDPWAGGPVGGPDEMAAAEDREQERLVGPPVREPDPEEEYWRDELYRHPLLRPQIFIPPHVADRLRVMPDGHLVDNLIATGDLVIMEGER